MFREEIKPGLFLASTRLIALVVIVLTVLSSFSIDGTFVDCTANLGLDSEQGGFYCHSEQLVSPFRRILV